MRQIKGKGENIKDMTGILFPHSYIPESLIVKVINLFGPIRIFQPWYIEPPDYLKDGPVELIYPPETLKPKGSFESLVKDYSQWAMQNQDRSYMEIIKSGSDNGPAENTTWEIRKLLTSAVKSASGGVDKDSLRWHVILHLARDIEEQSMSFDSALKDLKQKDALLQGSVENIDTTRDLLEDLPPLGHVSLSDGGKLEQLFGAWLGLFGEYLNDHELLITFNRHVMYNISERWDNLPDKDGQERGGLIEWIVPDLSGQPLTDKDSINQKDIEKRIRETIGLILDLHKNPEGNIDALSSLSKEFNDSLQTDLTGGTLKILIRYLYPVSDKELTQGDMIFGQLSNKTILLAEE